MSGVNGERKQADLEEMKAQDITRQLIKDIHCEYPVPKLIRDLRDKIELYVKEKPSRVQFVPTLIQEGFLYILSGWAKPYPKENFPYGRDVIAALKT